MPDVTLSRSLGYDASWVRLRRKHITGNWESWVLDGDDRQDDVLPRVAAGEPAAVRVCMDRYGALIWSLARRSCPSQADAEDAARSHVPGTGFAQEETCLGQFHEFGAYASAKLRPVDFHGEAGGNTREAIAGSDSIAG